MRDILKGRDMLSFIQTLGAVFNNVRDNNPGKLLGAVQEMKSHGGDSLSGSARGELFLLEAEANSALKNVTGAENAYIHSEDLFSQEGMDYHRIRTGLFYTRFLLKNSRAEEAQKKLEQLSQKPALQDDPYLHAMFSLCLSELLMLRLRMGNKNLTEKLIQELEKIVSFLQILDSPGMGFERDFWLIENREPEEMLLELYYRMRKTQRALFLIQKLKAREIRKNLLLNKTPWIFSGQINRKMLEQSSEKLQEEVKNYIKSQYLLYPFFNELKRSYKDLERDHTPSMAHLKTAVGEFSFPNITHEELKAKFNQAGKSLNIAYNEHIKNLEEAIFESPCLGQLEPQKCCLIPMLPTLMDEDSLALDYYIGKKALYVSTISQGSTNFYKIDKDSDSLLLMVEKLGKMGTKNSSGVCSIDEALNTLFDLYLILIEPISKEMESRKKIYISPHAHLNMVPFEALYDGKSYIGDKFDFVFLPSLIYLRKILQNPGFIIKMGSPVRITDNTDTSLKKKYEGWKMDLNNPDEAKEAVPASGQTLNTSGIVLMDGLINSGRLMTEFMELFSKPGSDGEPANFDPGMPLPPGILLTNIDYSGGINNPSNSLNSIVNLSFLSGSRMALANLWNLPRQVVSIFLKFFIPALLTRDIKGAFNLAQEQMAGRYNSHPYYWAGFQLFGDRGTIEFNQSPEWKDLDTVDISRLMQSQGKILVPPLVNNEILFSGGEDKYITAINSRDGSCLWKMKTTDWVNIPFTMESGVLYYGGMDKRVFAMEQKTGRKKWEYGTRGWIVDPPAVNRKFVFVVSKDGYLYALDQSKGRMVKKHFLGDVENAVVSVTDRNLIISLESRDRLKIFCFSGKTLELIWEKTLPEIITGRGFIEDEAYYFATGSGKLISVNIVNGRINWKIDVNLDKKQGPLPGKGFIYFLTDRSEVASFSLKDSKITWKKKLPTAALSNLVSFRNSICVVCEDRYLYGFDELSGDMNVKIPLEYAAGRSIHAQGNNLYSMDPDRGIYRVWLKNPGKTAGKTPNLSWKIQAGDLFSPTPFGGIIPGTKRCSLPIFAPDSSAPVPEVLNIPEESGSSLTKADLENPILKPAGADDFSGYSPEKKLEPDFDPAPPTGKDLPEELDIPDANTPKPSKRRRKSSVPIKQNEDQLSLYFSLVLITFFIGMAFYALVSQNVQFLIISMFALFFIGFFMVVGRLQDENQKIKSLFNRFVPSHLVDGFMKGYKTHEKEITVLFQDIYNYTTISETITNEQLYDLLDEIDHITDRVVSKYDGEIMSYIGDAYMITFNAVHNVGGHAPKAVMTALEISIELEKLGRKLTQETGIRLPCKLQMGYGIHTGKALVGIRGAQSKLEPFVLGDTANVAARLQSLTRELGYDIIVSGDTNKRLEGLYETRNLGKTRLKGKVNPIQIYSVFKDKKSMEPKKNRGLSPIYFRLSHTQE